MKIAERLEQRKAQWSELELFCDRLVMKGPKRLGAPAVARFAELYRSACADLALADAYELPPATVAYLNRLVSRAHNQLYRARNVAWTRRWTALLVDVPRHIFSDRCLQSAFVLFWGTFLFSAWAARWPVWWPTYAQQVLGEKGIETLERNFAQGQGGRDANANFQMAGFYIKHNTSIGLSCFAGGLAIVPGLLITVFNAANLGAAFGYMARPDVSAGAQFFNFVTAHGPFELTAIVLSAGAGLRLGLAAVRTGGLTRSAALQLAAARAWPVMASAMVLFLFAALIEGFISPTRAPYALKAGVAVVSSILLLVYFVILGFPRRWS